MSVVKGAAAFELYRAVWYRAGLGELSPRARPAGEVDYWEAAVWAPCGCLRVRLARRVFTHAIVGDLYYGVEAELEKCWAEPWAVYCRIRLFYAYPEEPRLKAYYLVPRWERLSQWLCSPYDHYHLYVLVYDPDKKRDVVVPRPGGPPYLVFDEPEFPQRLRNYYLFEAGVRARDVEPGKYELLLKGPLEPIAAVVLRDGPALLPLGFPFFPAAYFLAAAAPEKIPLSWKVYPALRRKGHEDSGSGRAKGSGEDPNSHFAGHIPPPGHR